MKSAKKLVRIMNAIVMRGHLQINIYSVGVIVYKIIMVGMNHKSRLAKDG